MPSYLFNHLSILGRLTPNISCAFISPYFKEYSQIFLRLAVVYVILIMTTIFFRDLFFWSKTIISLFRVVVFFYCNTSILT